MGEIKRIPNEIEIVFANHLKAIMRERGLTYETLKDITGVPSSTLHDYYHCKVAIPLETAKRIADRLEVNFSWMIGESNMRVKKIAK